MSICWTKNMNLTSTTSRTNTRRPKSKTTTLRKIPNGSLFSSSPAVLPITSIFAIIGVLLLITIYARSGLAIFFVGTPLIISIIYALAFTTLTVGHLNIVTSILVGLLTGMGIDFGIHLYWR